MRLNALILMAAHILCSSAEASSTYKISQVLKPADAQDSTQLLVRAGKKEGIFEGETLAIYRQGRGVWVEIGSAHAVKVQDGITVFDVGSKGDDEKLVKKIFPKHSSVMAGDLLVRKELNLAPRKVTAPVVGVEYRDIFIDPSAAPTTFELSDAGVKKLEDVVKAFADNKIETLMVEGYTDHNGSADINQVESIERAKAIRQILIDQFGFDANRVLAVGYGESEQLDRTFAPGYIERNRRIVFKVVPIMD